MNKPMNVATLVRPAPLREGLPFSFVPARINSSLSSVLRGAPVSGRAPTKRSWNDETYENNSDDEEAPIAQDPAFHAGVEELFDPDERLETRLLNFKNWENGESDDIIEELLLNSKPPSERYGVQTRPWGKGRPHNNGRRGRGFRTRKGGRRTKKQTRRKQTRRRKHKA